MTDTIPTLPPLTQEEFDVPVRLLRSREGFLLLETKTRIKNRYAAYRSNLRVRFGTDPDALKAELAQADLLEKEEMDVLEGLEKERGEDIEHYTFTFRAASIEDVDAAEAAAAVCPPELADLPEDVQKEVREKLGSVLDGVPVQKRAAFQEALANRTLLRHDYPNFPVAGEADFRKMQRRSLANYILARVAANIEFSADAHPFFPS